MRLLATKQTAINQYNGFGNQLWDIAGARPSLDLRFAENKSLGDVVTGQSLITFTRASSGTYVGSDGLIKSAVTNLLLQSEDFSTTWGGSGTIDANSVVAPNGTLTADTLTTATSAVKSQASQSFAAGSTLTVSVFAKKNVTNFLRFEVGNLVNCWYNLNTGTVGTSSAGSGNVLFSAKSIQSYPNGWYRCILTFTTSTITTVPILIFATTNDGQGVSGGESIHLWGAQLEQSSTVGEYIPTTSVINSAPRFDHNPVTGESLGLLVEESRTNLLLRSEEFGDAAWAQVFLNEQITANTATAPDGTQTADAIATVSGTAAEFGVGQNATITSGAACTYSVFAKSSASDFIYLRYYGGTNNFFYTVIIDLSSGTVTKSATGSSTTNASASVTAAGNGWYRISLTATHPGRTSVICIVGPAPSSTATIGSTFGEVNFTGSANQSVLIWGAQLEPGSFPTSYIPTTGSTVTRAADVASISGSAFSSWYRQDEGTILYDQTVFSYPTTTNASFYAFSDGTGDNRISGFIPSGSNHRLRIDESGSITYLVNAVLTADVLSPARVALGFKTNDVNCAYNGLIRILDQSVTIPLVDRLNFGEFNAAVDLSTRIKRFIFWPQRLSDSTLANITQ